MNEKQPAYARLSNQLRRIDLAGIARECGWLKRAGGKLSPEVFCQALVCSTQISAASLRVLAFVSGAISSISVSKQALHKRVDEKALSFLRSVLQAAASVRLSAAGSAGERRFKRVVIQDSTSLKLPLRMSGSYPASGNENGPAAGMKIHATYELIGRRFMGFEIRDGRTPDQLHAVDGGRGLGEGDLLVRDLGYFSVSAFARIIEGGLRMISRYKLNVALIDPATGKPIDLLAALRRGDRLDRRVLVGKGEKLPMRLVAFKLPEEVGEQRRRAFRQTARRKGHTPGKLSLQLQSWQIYLTNCDAEELDAEQVREFYRQRWGIEILFKAFKTHMRLEQVPPYASETMLKCLVLATLIRITLSHAFFLPTLSKAAHGGFVSELKFHSICEALGCLGLTPLALSEDLMNNIIRHSLYERRKRMSSPQKLALLG